MDKNGKLKIYVLDCLNEARYKGAVSKQKVKDSVSTKENKLGRPDIDENGKIILTKESLEMNNYYDQHNLDSYLYHLETGDPSYTYYGLLDYSFRSENDDRIMNDKECHKQNNKYIENIIDTCQGIYENTKQTKNFFVGTHGNRLKAALGIKGIDIANCFCLKISIKGTEILFDGFKMYEGDRIGRAHTEPVYYRGYGLDSDEDEDENVEPEHQTITSKTKKKRKCYLHKNVVYKPKLKDMNGCYKQIITKKKKKNILKKIRKTKYLDSEPMISYEQVDSFKKTDKKSNGITFTYKFENTKPLLSTINIYIIRHGDAMHNDKFNLGHNNIDSSLTPIGIMQAYFVGEIIKQNNENINLKNSCILSSYLNRAQHTALLALYSACDYPKNYYFTNVTNLFNNMAFTRVHEKIKDKKNKINFIKNKIKDFCEQNEVNGDEKYYNKIINQLPKKLKDNYF
jgi:hypothetical protein